MPNYNNLPVSEMIFDSVYRSFLEPDGQFKVDATTGEVIWNCIHLIFNI
jgi:hypothetical protein